MKLFKTSFLSDDIDYVANILKSGDIGFGSLVPEFESQFSIFSKKKFNVAVNSASAAAYMIFAFLMDKYGVCDVYTTSIGFISPVWAAKNIGHNIIFVDVNENLLFDVNHYTALKNSKTNTSNINRKKVLMPVLYGGVSNINGFDSLTDDEIVVVDSAHCVTPTIKSDFTFFSFHPFKPIASSDGGMVSTDHVDANNFFELYRNFGREVVGNTYDIVSNGFKFYMNNLNAGIALTQLKRYDDNLNIRKKCSELLDSKKLNGRMLPHDLHSSYYFNTLICSPDSVDMLQNKFPTSKHYPLIHKTKWWKYVNTGQQMLEQTEKLHPLILNLPLYDENIYNS